MKLTMRLFILLLFFLLSLHTNAFAQKMFTVIFSDKAIRTDVMGAQTYLKTTQALYSGEEVEILLTGIVGLIHKNGKTIELTKSGKYKVDSLVKMIGADSSRLSLLLLPFLKPRVPAWESHYHYEYSGTRSYTLLNTKVIPGNITVCWQPTGKPGKCVVTLTNENGEYFYEGTTIDTCIRIDLNKIDYSKLDPEIRASKSFQFLMHDELNPRNFITDHVFIELIDEKGLQRISTGETELSKINPPVSIVNLLLLAALYESEDLYFNALDKYQTAVSLYPDCVDLKVVYDGFLHRNGMIPSPY